MSDIMRPIPFGTLMDWVLGEYRNQGTVFGVPKGPVYQSRSPMFRETAEVPWAPPQAPIPSWPRTSSPPTCPGPGSSS